MQQGHDEHSGHDHVGSVTPAEHQARQQREHSHIVGWGADLDHRNRPAYPMERTPPRLEGVHWTEPEPQPVHMKVFHSTERPGITPVFGTSSPPSGLSGMMRDFAFRLSENDIRHWLILLLADRVNMVEGIGQDLMRGHVPNIFAEMGIKAEFRHNPAGLARKVAVASAVVGLGYYLLQRRRTR
ncbi:hypothetical protein SAMN06265795_11094 [Noviherbaspirillum humi]|uniref:Uncharacterized protein n=1 Tax=Noviherbaspirillum humi TaxID=1688639 RepID=A0A239IS57_9BURK|nr:hypothetical protein [Noviherbaspirillum humi]SNS96409.1 hypothetical protein SAMN06265795_11094 [Noviherbaspirillum humi]